MSSSDNILSTLVGILRKALGSDRPSRTPVRPRRPDSSAPAREDGGVELGHNAGTETIRLDPDSLPLLQIEYAPDRDGAPDAGEVIWTWVPYEENDGRGKDRPVLVIARQSADRAYAVRMTSKAHDGDRDYLSIGTGGWDAQGRESWVDVEQLYSVHDAGMRREAAVLDRSRFARVAGALVRRYGWRTGE